METKVESWVLGCSVTEGGTETAVRVEKVWELVARAEAAELSAAECHAVAAALHELAVLADRVPMAMVLQVTVPRLAASRGSKSLVSTVEYPDPAMVAETVQLLVETAGPALWAEIREVLLAPPEALKELLRAPAV